MTRVQAGHPDINTPWLVASRTMDQETMGKGDIKEFADRHGIDLELVQFMAQQRALRAILQGSPRGALIRKRSEEAEAGQLSREQALVAIELSDEEEARMVMFTAVYVEAMILGWWAKQIKPGDYPEWTQDGDDIRVDRGKG